ncbi:MAG TPA: RidA family protein [Opitutaceae bacterium]|nr:RidA family protein [Opitutaceae bacterium]
MDFVEEKLQKLGLKLPPPPTPAGSYVPFRMHGTTLYLAGVISTRDGQLIAGQAGKEHTVDSARLAAQACALNSLASIKAALGGFDRVGEFLFVAGYVNGIAGFDQSPAVINGASDLFVEIFGEAGRHARLAVTAAGLPRNCLVELQVTLSFKG